MADKSAAGELKPANNLGAQPAKIDAQIIVRDKDGKIKYQGPLIMQVKGDDHGGDAPHGNP